MSDESWIRTGRKALGLSQADLADKVSTNQANVSQWEAGKRTPSAAEMAALKRQALPRPTKTAPPYPERPASLIVTFESRAN